MTWFARLQAHPTLVPPRFLVFLLAGLLSVSLLLSLLHI